MRGHGRRRPIFVHRSEKTVEIRGARSIQFGSFGLVGLVGLVSRGGFTDLPYLPYLTHLTFRVRDSNL